MSTSFTKDIKCSTFKELQSCGYALAACYRSKRFKCTDAREGGLGIIVGNLQALNSFLLCICFWILWKLLARQALLSKNMGYQFPKCRIN